MGAWIGGTQNFVSGTNGDILLEIWTTIVAVIGLSLLGLVALSVLIWLVRVRPRKPQLDAEWNSDCELTTLSLIHI